jgi:hypothetical protein
MPLLPGQKFANEIEKCPWCHLVFEKNPNSGLSSFLHLSFCLKRDELEKKERIHNREKTKVKRLNGKTSKKITEYFKKQ